MGKKYKALLDIENRNLNVHEYLYNPDFLAYYEFCKVNKDVTIRSDSDGIIECLPFYVIDDFNLISFCGVWLDIEKNGYDIILSNGHKFDNNLICNLVGYVESNGNFELEYCYDKVPLRYMYNGRNLIYSKGNIFTEELYGCKYINYENIFDFVYKLLYDKELFKRHVEMSLYNIPVGTKKSNVIYWQI